MKYLLNRRNLKLLEPLHRGRTLYAFDFDGTLARIVSNPADAFMEQKTKRLLLELAKKAPVAVVSGRQVQDLQKRLPPEIPWLVGNHGLEGVDKAQRRLREARRQVSKWKKLLSPFLTQNRDLDLEDKNYSLSLHYRRSKRKKIVHELILEWIGQWPDPPRVIPGKSVLNLVPMEAPHKGIALQEILKKLKASKALYIGDDETDEDVFKLRDQRVLSVHVGKKQSSKASFYLRDQSEVNILLETLVDSLEKKPHHSS